ncbi:uncharacterized protein ATNIH1004_008068 [Aspergillus tanneri]|uniref:Retrotransposon gag domain-containing protein n=1 Tax=Aspergillus tanneri TaxID=1220188 RepID=A0A5M9MI17_9EURO|nr:uncharacterized protein ATNIH1004_008068 [Aspergillus tanneri]KAA8646635.1 hypothetical protein ATNIH1004_008068 [Aspergillus tanneri]
MSDPNPLLLLVQQLQQELQNQRLDIQNQRNEIQQLRADLDASRTDVHQLRTQLLSVQTPRSRLPDPPRFNGKPYTLRTWLPSIKAKLRSDQLVGADAFDYVWDRLEQSQQASVLHLRQSAEENQLWDPEQEAIQRFTSIQQRDDESLIAYLARFERLSYEANVNSWPDISRVTTLHRGLRPNLRRILEDSNNSLFDLPYNEYIELVQSTDRRTRPSPKSAPKPALTPNTDPMDTDPVRVNSVKINPNPVHVGSVRVARAASPVLSDSSHESTTSDRRRFRLANNLCLYCGSNDHWIADCDARSTLSDTSEKPPKSLQPAPATRLAIRPPSEALYREGGVV